MLLELEYISIKGYLDTMYEIPNSLNVCQSISWPYYKLIVPKANISHYIFMINNFRA